MANLSETQKYYKLYVVELENRKLFLKCSADIYKDYLMQECYVMYDFVKKNPPVKVLDVISLQDVLEIDYYVKYYMRNYGIQNVRGGNYTDEILSKEDIQHLEKEIDKTFEDYEEENDIFEEILMNHQMKPLNNDFVLDIKHSLKYIQDRKKLVSVLYDVENYDKIENFQIFQEIIKDIEWLQETAVEKQRLYKEYNESHQNENTSPWNLTKMPNFIETDEKIRYKKILQKLDFLRNIYFKVDIENLSKYLDAYLRTKIGGFKKYDTTTFMYVHMKKPQYALDNLILHPRLVIRWDTFMEFITELLDEFSYMAYSLHNLTSELLYDISRQRPDFEKRVQYTVEYYNLLEEGNLGST